MGAMVWMMKCTECGDPFGAPMQYPIYQLCEPCMEIWKQKLKNESFTDVVEKNYKTLRSDVMSSGARVDFMEQRLRVLDPEITFSRGPLLQIMKVYAKSMGKTVPELTAMLADQHCRWKAVGMALSSVSLAQESATLKACYEANYGADAYLNTPEGKALDKHLRELCCYSEGPKDDDEDVADRFAQIG